LPVWIGSVLLLICAAVVYLPCLNGELVFDDNEWIVDLQWAFKTWDGLRMFWMVPGTSQQYYPLTATSFWIDYQLWGLNTFPYHLENVLLHGVSGILFWLLLRQLGIGGAFIAATLYVVHPVMVESVSWITERKNVLSQALVIAAMLSYGRSLKNWDLTAISISWRWWWIAFLFFVAAVLAKITAFVFPAAILVIVWWKYRKVLLRRDILPVLPMFAFSIAACILVHWMETEVLGASGKNFEMPLASRFVVAGQILLFYIGKLLWPHPICVIYYRWTVDPSLWWQWSGIVICALIAGLFAWKTIQGRWRGSTAAVLLFLGMISPLIGFMNVYGMLYAWVADRWLYMPALPLFACFGHLWSSVYLAWPRTLVALTSIALLACGILTWQQAATYRTIDTFWLAAINGNANPWKARSDYADALITAGRASEAVDQLHRAIIENPNTPDVFCNLGVAHNNLGQNKEALDAFEKALEIDPSMAVVHYNIGKIHSLLGNVAESEKFFRRAFELKPDFITARNDLGNLLFQSGKLKEAEAEFRSALSKFPTNTSLLTSLGNTLYWLGEHKMAMDHFEQALKIDPKMVSALSNYAFALTSTDDQTLRDIDRGLQLSSEAAALSNYENLEILTVLAKANFKAGNFLGAAEAARTAAKIADRQNNPSYARQLRETASAYALGKETP
jgi:tetratricopeptide (TPR) repeat protein